MRNVAVIMRAVPGSGKTTLLAALADGLAAHNIAFERFSTDDFFVRPDSAYVFDPEKLGEFHRRNLLRFADAIRRGVRVVVCDNTNIERWEVESYASIARAAGYYTLLLNMLPRALSEHSRMQKHHISEDSLRFICEKFKKSDARFPVDEKLDIVPDQFRPWCLRITETMMNLLK